VTAGSHTRPKTTKVFFSLEDGREIVLEDPRGFGRVTVHEERELSQLLAEYGPEPLSPEFTPETFVATAQSSRTPIKLFLLDQSRVAGLGNIWAAEALYAAGIHPARPANKLRPARLRALHTAIVTILRYAVQSALAVALQPADFPDAVLLPVGVYGREGEACTACRRTIRRMVQGGRSTYYCPGCQR
jgi:formamidopyrimidine-DNA glycosylase